MSCAEVEQVLFETPVPSSEQVETLLKQLKVAAMETVDSKTLFIGALMVTMEEMLSIEPDIKLRLYLILHLCTCFPSIMTGQSSMSTRLRLTLDFAFPDLELLIKQEHRRELCDVYAHVHRVRLFWYSL